MINRLGITVKVWVDRAECEGCGGCEDRAPAVFKKINGLGFVLGRDGGVLWNEVGTTNVGLADVPEESRNATLEAAEACPGEAINVEP